MPDERDRRRIITPPAGVRMQTSPETWEDLTPPPEQEPITPGAVNAAALHKMGRRVKVTARTSLAILEAQGSLRAELDAKVDELAREVASLREGSARNEGKLDVLVDALDSERVGRRQYEETAVRSLRAGVEVTNTRALSEIEVQRSDALAEVADRTERRAYRRQLVIKIFAGAAAAWGLVSTIAAARCG